MQIFILIVIYHFQCPLKFSISMIKITDIKYFKTVNRYKRSFNLKIMNQICAEEGCHT